MEQYIKKSDLVARVEKIRAKWFGVNNDFANGQKGALTDVLSLINTLETKETNLDKEIENYFKGFGKFPSVGIADCIDIAKHFFELGMQVSNKAQKGEL